MNEIDQLCNEVSKLEERFLEKDQDLKDLPNDKPVETENEKSEVVVYAQLALNSAHTGYNVLRMMLDTQHQGALIKFMGEEGVGQARKFEEVMNGMSDFFEELLANADPQKEEPEIDDDDFDSENDEDLDNEEDSESEEEPTETEEEPKEKEEK